MSDVPAAPPPIELPARPGPPPLRVHHLLAWMAATAVLITACLSFDRTMRGGPPITNIVVIGALTVCAIFVSGALCCECWGFYWPRRGYAYPVEPGERLVALVAAAVVGLVAAMALSLFVFFVVEHDAFPFVWYSSRIALLLVLMGTCVRIARQRCDTMPWRVLFYVLAALPLVIWVMGAMVAAIVTLVALVFAVWNDWRRQIARRWTHWFGVSVLAMIVLSCGAITLFPSSEHWPASSWLQ